MSAVTCAPESTSSEPEPLIPTTTCDAPPPAGVHVVPAPATSIPPSEPGATPRAVVALVLRCDPLKTSKFAFPVSPTIRA